MRRVFNPTYQTKGDDIFDVSTLNNALSKLKEVYDTRITDLRDEYLTYFEYLTQVVKKYQNTPKYAELYDIIIKQFSDIKDFRPGTVANYILGCFKFNGKSCIPNCKDSIPLPQQQPCNDKILIAQHNGIRYNFIDYNNKNSNKAYIFVDKDNFKNLNEEDKRNLKLYGIKEFKLIGHKNFKDYTELGSWTRLDDSTSNSYNSIIIFLLIVIILAIAVIMLKR
jgi:hypothetical protein